MTAAGYRYGHRPDRCLGIVRLRSCLCVCSHHRLVSCWRCTRRYWHWYRHVGKRGAVVGRECLGGGRRPWCRDSDTHGVMAAGHRPGHRSDRCLGIVHLRSCLCACSHHDRLISCWRFYFCCRPCHWRPQPRHRPRLCCPGRSHHRPHPRFRLPHHPLIPKALKADLPQMGESAPHDVPGHPPSDFEGTSMRNGRTTRKQGLKRAQVQDLTSTPACQLPARRRPPQACGTVSLAHWQKATASPSVTAVVYTTQDRAQAPSVKASEDAPVTTCSVRGPEAGTWRTGSRRGVAETGDRDLATRATSATRRAMSVPGSSTSPSPKPSHLFSVLRPRVTRNYRHGGPAVLDPSRRLSL